MRTRRSTANGRDSVSRTMGVDSRNPASFDSASTVIGRLFTTRAVAVLLVGATLAVSGCNPGATEARRLRSACEAGDQAACNDFAFRLLRGEHVLRDRARAAGLFDEACEGNVAQACVRLGGMHHDGLAV
ncbi:MAG: hypothetical protein PVH00_12900, partial [Gemmatimonadota bacterium]